VVDEVRVAGHIVEIVVRQAIDGTVAHHARNTYLVLAGTIGFAVSGGWDTSRAVGYVGRGRAATCTVARPVGSRGRRIGIAIVVHAELVIGTTIDGAFTWQRADGNAHRAGIYPLVEQLTDGRRRDARARLRLVDQRDALVSSRYVVVAGYIVGDSAGRAESGDGDKSRQHQDGSGGKNEAGSAQHALSDRCAAMCTHDEFLPWDRSSVRIGLAAGLPEALALRRPSIRVGA